MPLKALIVPGPLAIPPVIERGPRVGGPHRDVFGRAEQGGDLGVAHGGVESLGRRGGRIPDRATKVPRVEQRLLLDLTQDQHGP